MLSLIDGLEAFDRKERHFLVRFVIGPDADRLDEGFRTAVGEALDLHIPVTARWWMDYHLDWLYAALVLHSTPVQERYPSPGFAGGSPTAPLLNVNANQEDVDLLVAFEDGGVTHLVLLEAKADTAWTNKQIRSKVRRLTRIFPDGGQSYGGIQPHLVLCSPRQPRSLDVTLLPEWMLNGRLRCVGSPSRECCVDADRAVR